MTVYYIRQQHLLTTHTLVIFFRCDRRGVARRPPLYPHSYSTRSPFGACLLNFSPQPSWFSEGVDPPQCCQLSPLSSEYLRDHSYISSYVEDLLNVPKLFLFLELRIKITLNIQQ